MMKHMSFALTKDQILEQTKTVTRRLGWDSLKPGDMIQPVEKCMGLKKGQKRKKIGCPIRITSFNKERLQDISRYEVEKEGFPDLNPQEFISFFCKAMRCSPDTVVNRIEFEYVDNPPQEG
jgi:hypothetical protein